MYLTIVPSNRISDTYGINYTYIEWINKSQIATFHKTYGIIMD